MADFKVVYHANTGRFEFELCRGTFDMTEGLATAVMISLFTDARAENDDDIPDGSTDRRGWWATELVYGRDARIGSRRWLLAREKQLDRVLQRFEEYDREALQWLIDDGVADRVEVIAENNGPGAVLETIRIYRPGDTGGPWEFLWRFEQQGMVRCIDRFEKPDNSTPPLDLDTLQLLGTTRPIAGVLGSNLVMQAARLIAWQTLPGVGNKQRGNAAQLAAYNRIHGAEASTHNGVPASLQSYNFIASAASSTAIGNTPSLNGYNEIKGAL